MSVKPRRQEHFQQLEESVGIPEDTCGNSDDYFIIHFKVGTETFRVVLERDTDPVVEKLVRDKTRKECWVAISSDPCGLPSAQSVVCRAAWSKLNGSSADLGNIKVGNK